MQVLVKIGWYLPSRYGLLFDGSSELSFTKAGRQLTFNSGGSSDLVVYVGHDGLMDFTLESTPKARDQRKRKAIILACVSQKYFAKPPERTGADPLVWTTWSNGARSFHFIGRNR